MPIVMKLKNERACPTVVCDLCHEEIEDAREGNAQWMMGQEGQGDGATIFFTHTNGRFLPSARWGGASVWLMEYAPRGLACPR